MVTSQCWVRQLLEHVQHLCEGLLNNDSSFILLVSNTYCLSSSCLLLTWALEHNTLTTITVVGIVLLHRQGRSLLYLVAIRTHLFKVDLLHRKLFIFVMINYDCLQAHAHIRPKGCLSPSWFYLYYKVPFLCVFQRINTFLFCIGIWKNIRKKTPRLSTISILYVIWCWECVEPIKPLLCRERERGGGLPHLELHHAPGWDVTVEWLEPSWVINPLT